MAELLASVAAASVRQASRVRRVTRRGSDLMQNLAKMYYILDNKNDYTSDRVMTKPVPRASCAASAALEPRCIVEDSSTIARLWRLVVNSRAAFSTMARSTSRAP